MFKREITELLLNEAVKFKIFAIIGPRQSGKTTILKEVFTEYKYISLESPDMLDRLADDVKGFFSDKTQKWIIDEAQKFPPLFSYLQEFIDDVERQNRFILSSSQNFLLHNNISQTLAGRIAIYELLPLTYMEYKTYEPKLPSLSLWEYLYQGQYPRPYHEKLPTEKWFSSYLQTYVERDVRMIENIKDLSKFRLFIKLCAGYHGQQLNISQISIDSGMSQPTIQNWLSLLEASFIIFRLEPYYKNYNKRLVKSPKLYFYDTAIICQLLGIESAEHLKIHSARGAIFEGFIISEIIKSMKNAGNNSKVYYWKSYSNQEIDLLIDTDPIRIMEIKSGSTFQKTFTDNLLNWQILENNNTKAFVIYAGEEKFTFKNIDILPWDQISKHIL
ncbi:MAG UNVERIFIED_CONTAM: ATP-binding protein [Rickettsiaceae bacterium]|jgi:predicted AAA+ superfamily ATPase